MDLVSSFLSILVEWLYYAFEWLGAPFWWVLNQVLELIPDDFVFDTSLLGDWWPRLNAWVPLDLAFQCGAAYTAFKLALAALRFIKAMVWR